MENRIKQGFLKTNQEFVKKCDEKFEEELSLGVKKLVDGRDLRVIGLTGPTCSGKTTAAKKLISYLGDSQKIVHIISLDDFYREAFSRQELDRMDISEVDFDSPDTLDTELFEKFVTELFTKGSATKPIFDFKTGERKEQESFVADDDDVFLLEGIQVLYPKVISVIEKMGGAIMCVCPQSSIAVENKIFEPNLIRLCRRLVRDTNFRGSDPEFTFSVWDGVRKNEEENIFPHLHVCDVMVDTTHAYELNILAPYLRKYLSSISAGDKHYEKAMEILDMFSHIEGIDSKAISRGSLYHEFV